MPCVSPKSRSRVFQWLELEPLGREPDLPSVGKQTFAVCRNEVCHRVTLPSMAVEPEATIHCEDHPVEAAAKLAESRCCFRGYAKC